MKNLPVLIAAFVLGQGCIFLAQTILIAEGNASRVVDFGLNYSIFIMLALFVESGALTILARQVVDLQGKKGSAKKLVKQFLEMTVYRGILAFLITTAVFIYFYFSGWGGGFSWLFFMAALPALFVQATNLTGFLDGMRRSGYSGIANGIPHMVAASTLFLTKDWEAELAATYIGGSIFLGYVISWIVQYKFVRKLMGRFPIVKPSYRGVLESSKSGLGMLLVLSPGQVFQRIQLLLCNWFLGVETTSLFIYAKQMVAGCNQVVAFSRRVEFPDLTEKVKLENACSYKELLIQQKTSFLLALVFFVGVNIFAVVGQHYNYFEWSSSAGIIAIVSVTIITEVVSGSSAQILLAAGKFLLVGRIRLIAVILSGVGSYFLAKNFGLYGVVASEVLVHCVVAVSCIILFFNRLAKI